MVMKKATPLKPFFIIINHNIQSLSKSIIQFYVNTTSPIKLRNKENVFVFLFSRKKVTVQLQKQRSLKGVLFDMLSSY